MVVIAAAIGLIILYLILYYLFGFATLYVMGGRRTCNPVWIGMFVYAILFFLVAFPMKLAQMPLKIVGIIWLGTVLGISALILFYLHREIGGAFREWIATVWQFKWIAPLVLVVVAVALVYTESQENVGSGWDSAFYVGEVSTSVYEGVMETTDAIHGTDLGSFSSLYMLETYLMHSAVVCTLTGIPALIEVRTVMVAVLIIVFFILMWDIGIKLFDKDYWKTAVLFWIILLVYLFSDSLFWPGSFMLMRTFEGKSVLANFFVPATFYCFMCLWEEDTRENWICLFITMMASFTYSMSAIFLMPVALAGYGVVLVWRGRKWKIVRNLVICLLPCLVAAIVYILMSKGILQVLIC